VACNFNAISPSIAYFLYLFYNHSVHTLDQSVSVCTIYYCLTGSVQFTYFHCSVM
jgi:hypothetical protein